MSFAKGKLLFIYLIYSPKWCLIIIFANLFKYANYLIKYARYKNVPNRNEFYRKNHPRNHREKFGSDDYLIAVGSALSNSDLWPGVKVMKVTVKAWRFIAQSA